MKRLLLFLLLACGLRAQTPTLHDFGYESMQSMGRVARGTVPLLLLTVQFTGQPAMAHSNSTWDNLVFPFGNAATSPTANGYFLENSLGAFYFTRALTTTPALITLSAAETMQVNNSTYTYTNAQGQQITLNGFDTPTARTYLFNLVTQRTGINWSQWDTNGDNVITQGELFILMVTNRSSFAAEMRGMTVPITGTPTSLNLLATFVSHRTSLMTIVHELTHALGAETDLYGDGNQNVFLSLMGNTTMSNVDDRRLFHLDPWYKMRLGWLRPRIFNLDAGGLARLRCPQSPFPLTEAEGPVILYSPSRGSVEYFMLEWRNGNPPAGRGYDAHVESTQTRVSAVPPGLLPGSGLAVWHVRQNANHTPMLLMSNRLWSAYHMSPALPAGQPDAFFNLGPFNLGGRILWDALTPPLIWQDAAPTGIVVLPHPSRDGGNSILVEWLSGAAHWGDFFSGLPSPNGTFANPWQTIATAVQNTPRGGRLNLKSSSTAATIVIDKRLIIEASHNGPAVIGQ